MGHLGLIPGHIGAALCIPLAHSHLQPTIAVNVSILCGPPSSAFLFHEVKSFPTFRNNRLCPPCSRCGTDTPTNQSHHSLISVLLANSRAFPCLRPSHWLKPSRKHDERLFSAQGCSRLPLLLLSTADMAAQHAWQQETAVDPLIIQSTSFSKTEESKAATGCKRKRKWLVLRSSQVSPL